MATLKIHTSIVGAAAIKAVGEVVITAKWKETANQSRKELAVIIPMECVRAPDVPESFRALVEAALLESAEGTLKLHGEVSAGNFEIESYNFDRPALTEFFLQRGDVWMSKESLELEFTRSATWKRITSKPEFQTNQAYKNAAEQFKTTILKLTGKAVQLKKEQCEVLLTKIEEADLETQFGAFVVKRLGQLARKTVDDVDLSML